MANATAQVLVNISRPTITELQIKEFSDHLKMEIEKYFEYLEEFVKDILSEIYLNSLINSSATRHTTQSLEITFYWLMFSQCWKMFAQDFGTSCYSKSGYWTLHYTSCFLILVS